MALPVEPNAETEGPGVLEDVFGNREVFDREAERVDKDVSSGWDRPPLPSASSCPSWPSTARPPLDGRPRRSTHHAETEMARLAEDQAAADAAIRAVQLEIRNVDEEISSASRGHLTATIGRVLRRG